MKKEVLITITGVQNSLEDGENIVEMTVSGEYYLKGDRHYLLYRQTEEDGSGNTKNIVKCKNGYMEVTKRGDVNSLMLFEDGKEFVSPYTTPFGEIMMGFTTEQVTVTESDKEIILNAVYALYMDESFVADCSLTMKIVPRGEGLFHLFD